LLIFALLAALAACGGGNGGGGVTLPSWAGNPPATAAQLEAKLKGEGYTVERPTPAEFFGDEDLPDGVTDVVVAYKGTDKNGEGIVSYYFDGNASALSYFNEMKQAAGLVPGITLVDDHTIKITGAGGETLMTVANNVVTCVGKGDGMPGGAGGSQTEPPDNTVWPTAQIAAVLGAGNLPTYTGTFATASVHAVSALKTVTVTVTGGGADFVSAYETLLTNSGYAFSSESGKYTKTVSGGKIEVTVSGYNGTYVVAAQLISNAGEQTEFPADVMTSLFGAGNIPAFAGASSFSHTETSAYGVSNCILTAYGVDNAKIDAYKAALSSAGYNYTNGAYHKITDDGTKEIVISVDNGMTAGQAIIGYTKSPYSAPAEYRPSLDTLPANLYVNAGINGEVYKIGNDYLLVENAYSARYLKYNSANNYTCYEGTLNTEFVGGQPVSAWEWDDGETITNAQTIEDEIYYIFDEFLEDYDSYIEYEVTGTETVLGKTCTVYEDISSYGGYTYGYRYFVTSEGWVLKIQMTTDGSVWSSSYGYEVTGLSTAGVAFPQDIPLPQ
jgi:hypothetical protein